MSQPPPTPGTNPLAVASLVLGVLWIYAVGSIAALVLGYVARRQVQRTGQAGAGMALVGIVLGWLGVVVLMIILAGAVLVA